MSARITRLNPPQLHETPGVDSSTHPLAGAFSTACTLVGVAALGYVDQLVELDRTVALPAE